MQQQVAAAAAAAAAMALADALEAGGRILLQRM